MKNILICISLTGGLFFLLVGTIGLLRFPDIYTRAHSAAKCDTLGAILCLFALMLYGGLSFASLKLSLVIIFLWMTSPTATHLIAKANYKVKKRNY
ncbi:monovalent cation/H(+) antiporter subunit G [Maledivibacter halophilus]|uniref:Multisubunit sodium/proton antiporter, MrpG subunit n=1 Tax=Maledivibacter halophilus TaxID=36842 RepID=A0A1T5ML31_9FIRM|nr:monovalent cation/H(+) antiporter subunit G [Maledivibacter halophilus]SKC88937.1 multisubunit sodium/proton antiporter, MrpG subunit [Maledivibacter halophilus]